MVPVMALTDDRLRAMVRSMIRATRETRDRLEQLHGLNTDRD